MLHQRVKILIQYTLVLCGVLQLAAAMCAAPAGWWGLALFVAITTGTVVVPLPDAYDWRRYWPVLAQACVVALFAGDDGAAPAPWYMAIRYLAMVQVFLMLRLADIDRRDL